MSVDSILLMNVTDEKLVAFLRKMGFSLIVFDGSVPLPSLLPGKLIDLVLVDGRGALNGLELCEFLSSDQLTRDAATIYLAQSAAEAKALQAEGLNRLQVVTIPYRTGQLVSLIATELRLRKMAGADEHAASLSEANAALRELTTRFEKELAEARQIQEDLLPPALKPDSRFEVSTAYEPLDQVGGDWYYHRIEPSGALTVQIADVTGHGLSAALIGSMTKLALAAADTEEPGSQLERMNLLMSKNIPSGKFVTMFAYRYDPASGHLKYARAGHPPALLLNKSSQKVSELKGDGFAIGFMDDGDYQTQEAKLEVGDVLISYTDGIVEAQNRSGELYGTARLAEALKAASRLGSSKEMVEAILLHFHQFIDGRILKDDVTLIVLKRNA